jgi:NitT/TauT family transport system substrate-binding protein
MKERIEMKKLVSSLLIVILLLTVFVGCEKAPEPFEISVIAPYGTPVLSMVKMIEENPEITDYVSVNYEPIQATDVLTARLINNEADIAIVPTNLAANLFSKGIEYQLAGVTGWGAFYMIASEEISSIEDLKGRTITTIGRGLTPDAMLRYILSENGLEPDVDVIIEYLAGASELAANYIAGEIDLAMIPQPVLTSVLMKREDSIVVIDVQAAWSDITGYENYPQASIVVSTALIEEHPEVVENFLAEFNLSEDWLNENPAEAGAYYENLGIGLNAIIVEKAIPASNLDFHPVAEAKEVLNAYFEVLYNFNPELIGGQSVDEAMYFDQK